MALNPPLLRATLELVVGRNPNLTLRFYEILFERYPALQPLFSRNSRDAQAKMLAQALIATVDHLEDGDWLVQNLGALGQTPSGIWGDRCHVWSGRRCPAGYPGRSGWE